MNCLRSNQSILRVSVSKAKIRRKLLKEYHPFLFQISQNWRSASGKKRQYLATNIFVALILIFTSLPFGPSIKAQDSADPTKNITGAGVAAIASATMPEVTPTTPGSTLTPDPSSTSIPSISPTYTVGIPTSPPTVTPIPDINYVQQEIGQLQADLLSQLVALPALTNTITGTLVTGLTGGRITSADGNLTVGFLSGAIPATNTLNVKVNPVSFQPGDPRATRNGQPLVYTFELSATDGLTGQPITHFSKDVTLVWDMDGAELAAAGVYGWPLRLYTYDETTGNWQEVQSWLDMSTNQLMARTPHFSIYAVGSGFDKVNQYLPTINNFETDLQSGTASTSYPINLPVGPGGFGPKVSLSYNSGAVDRVDGAQQGSSSVGWGWTLPTSYIASSQHHFGTKNPWTASIAVEGVNGDLTLGADSNWHTSNENYAKIIYHQGVTGYERTSDWWEVWDKAGTHYVFDLNSLIYDGDNTPNGLTTNRWMLHTATDVHGNTITYNYRWEEKNGTTQFDDEPPYTSTYRIRAVYPRQITYGAGGDKIEVDFNRASRTDYWSADTASEIYMGQRITGIEVKRKQQSTSSYSVLRSYEFIQDYSIVMTQTGTSNTYPHLTLTEIVAHGQASQSRLPSTLFVYYTGAESFADIMDKGHLYQAHNGYGGEVRYYYDAAAADLNSAYRRVRAKRVLDGMGDSTLPQGVSTAHNALYSYDYRGAQLNSVELSADANGTYPVNAPYEEFRGFAWTREQDPSGQSVDHYYLQDDALKAKEYRSQVGKSTEMTATMSTTPSSDANWSVTGSVSKVTDPYDGANSVWDTPISSSIMRTGTGVMDGSDVAMRIMLRRGDSEDTGYRMVVTDTIRNANNNGEYWGVQVSRVSTISGFRYDAKVVWAVLSGGTLVKGTRELSRWVSTTLLPFRPNEMDADAWYWVRLHTSPDGLFVAEFHQQDADYIALKSGESLGGGLTIPLFPTGQNWKFKHDVSFQSTGANYDHVLVDDYSETRSVYSQADSAYGATSIATATPDYNQYKVGLANNCTGMKLRFTPLTASANTMYGANYELGQVKRSKTSYDYDSYGNQKTVAAEGNLAISGDESTTFTTFHNVSSSWVLGKPQYTRVYSATGVSDVEGNGYLMAKTINYYDGATNPATAPTDGDVTKVEQVGVLNGVLQSGTVSSQQIEYDGYGNQTKVTDPLGNHTDTDYDKYYYSFPITTTYPNTSKQYISYDYTLDAAIAMTDVNGTVTRSDYDVFGRPQKSWTSPYGSDTSPNEIYKFVDTGVYSVTAPFYMSYTVKMDTATGPNGHTFGLRWFDGRGRTIQDITPKDTSNAAKVDTFYNINSQVTTTTLPYQASYSYPPSYSVTGSQPQIISQYDGIGRTTVVTNADGTSVGYDYSFLLLELERDEPNQVTKGRYIDMLGRTTQVFQHDNSSSAADMNVFYDYDILGRLLKVTRDKAGANQTTSTMQYDSLGRKSQMTDPDMGPWEYEYDLAGNLTKQRDALYLSNTTTYADHQIFFAYDSMNRITAKYYGQTHFTNGVPDVKYYYDNAMSDASTAESWGKLRAAEVTAQGQGQDKATGHQYFYEARGLLYTEAITTGLTTRPYTTTYAYDDAGRLASTTYPDAETTHEVISTYYNEQGMGLPSSLETSNTSVKPVWSSTYNIKGQLTQILQGSASSNFVTTNFGYDDGTTKRGWLTNTTVLTSTNQILNLSLGYSTDGNITSVSQSATYGGGTINPTFTNSYTYDAFDRLKTAASTCSCTGSALFAPEEYTFDSISRMTLRKLNGTLYSVSYSDSAHKDAPTGYNGHTYTYDVVGNQTVRTISGSGLTQNRTFDAENRVTTIISGTYTTNMIYGPNGERVIKSVTAANGTGDGGEGGGKDGSKIGNGGNGANKGGGTGATESLPGAGGTLRTLYAGPYEEELPYNQTISWGSVTNASTSSPVYSLKKTSFGALWDAGAISTQSISTGDGFVSAVANATTTDRMFGLGNANVNAGQSDLEFGLILKSNGILEVMEGGSSKGTFGAYYTGDVLKVTVVAGAVKYYRNDTLLYTSGAKSISYPLYLDTSIATSGGVITEALLCSGSKCVSAPEYTAYYSFGGKTVGMRTAHASVTSRNGQFRMIGDQLGSTTLILDAASPPNVVQRQYHTPYGEMAWQYTASMTGGESLTTVGYTGQRTDEESTGLIFYNSRMYDPTLAFFISADNVVPGTSDVLVTSYHEVLQTADERAESRNQSPPYATNPQDLHRYTYVMNNPIGYNDPTGHTVYMTQDEANQYRLELLMMAFALENGYFDNGASSEGQQFFLDAWADYVEQWTDGIENLPLPSAKLAATVMKVAASIFTLKSNWDDATTLNMASDMRGLAKAIGLANKEAGGIAITYNDTSPWGGTFWVMNQATGQLGKSETKLTTVIANSVGGISLPMFRKEESWYMQSHRAGSCSVWLPRRPVNRGYYFDTQGARRYEKPGPACQAAIP